MDEEDPLTWEVEPYENFLDFHFLYRAVHKILWRIWPDLNRIYPNFFTLDQTINGLSFDWSKYATSKFTLNSRPEPELNVNGVVELNVGKVKSIIKNKSLPLTIRHNPIRESPVNRAHTILEGIGKINKAKIKIELSNIANWAQNMKPIKQ